MNYQKDLERHKIGKALSFCYQKQQTWNFYPGFSDIYTWILGLLRLGRWEAVCRWHRSSVPGKGVGAWGDRPGEVIGKTRKHIGRLGWLWICIKESTNQGLKMSIFDVSVLNRHTLPPLSFTSTVHQNSYLHGLCILPGIISDPALAQSHRRTRWLTYATLFVEALHGVPLFLKALGWSVASPGVGTEASLCCWE